MSYLSFYMTTDFAMSYSLSGDSPPSPAGTLQPPSFFFNHSSYGFAARYTASAPACVLQKIASRPAYLARGSAGPAEIFFLHCGEHRGWTRYRHKHVTTHEVRCGTHHLFQVHTSPLLPAPAPPLLSPPATRCPLYMPRPPPH